MEELGLESQTGNPNQMGMDFVLVKAESGETWRWLPSPLDLPEFFFETIPSE